VGRWKDNLYHGQGALTIVNGGNYIGEWKEGNRHGEGVLTFVDGRKYVGNFANNLFHAEGTLTYPNKTSRVGQWHKGKFIEPKEKIDTVMPDGLNKYTFTKEVLAPIWLSTTVVANSMKEAFGIGDKLKLNDFTITSFDLTNPQRITSGVAEYSEYNVMINGKGNKDEV